MTFAVYKPANDNHKFGLVQPWEFDAVRLELIKSGEIHGAPWFM